MRHQKIARWTLGIKVGSMGRGFGSDVFASWIPKTVSPVTINNYDIYGTKPLLNQGFGLPSFHERGLYKDYRFESRRCGRNPSENFVLTSLYVRYGYQSSRPTLLPQLQGAVRAALYHMSFAYPHIFRTTKSISNIEKNSSFLRCSRSSTMLLLNSSVRNVLSPAQIKKNLEHSWSILKCRSECQVLCSPIYPLPRNYQRKNTRTLSWGAGLLRDNIPLCQHSNECP